MTEQEAYQIEIADDIASADAYAEWTNDVDVANAAAYAAFVADAVRTAYAKRARVGETERSAYYDTTTYSFVVDPRFGLNADAVRNILAHRDGHSMAAYGSFGGYSTVGLVTQQTPDLFVVESVYHIGD